MSDESLSACWSRVRARGRAALIPYITAGYPDAAATRGFLDGAAGAGADIIELGVPWSDPVADGPVIQASTHDALARGTTLARVLDQLAERPASVPVVIFSYLNPILAFGATRFAARARAVGAGGLLVLDLPVGSDPAVETQLRASGLPLVRLVAPTTTAPRLAEIARASEGFVYLVARLGVTGRQGADASARRSMDLAARVAAVRAVSTLPVAVGFGIAEPQHAVEVAAMADGVVIGSALVEKMKAGGAAAGLEWMATIRRAMDRAASAA